MRRKTSRVVPEVAILIIPPIALRRALNRFLNLPLRGVAWYQGESNAHNPDSWRFDLLARSWRMRMGDFSLPFYVVQLSGIERPSWPWMRNTQRIAQRSVFATQMVVSSDLGLRHDVHPPYKRPVGERLAQSMLRHTYDRSGAPVLPKWGRTVRWTVTVCNLICVKRKVCTAATDNPCVVLKSQARINSSFLPQRS